MRLSELRKLVREIVRESVIDDEGLERAGIALPQTKEKKSKKIGEDKIPGGLAGGMKLSDIAEKHGVSVDILVAEFKKGIGVEMEHTTDREIAKEIALDHLFEDPKYYTKLSKIENPTNEGYTKGQLFGGTIKIGGQPVKVEVELLGADDKKKVFVTKVINIDKKYLSKLPSNGVLEIPARIFRTPGGGWYKIKTPSVFEHDDCGCGCGGVTEGGCNTK
jgi:hypothetical protein